MIDKVSDVGMQRKGGDVDLFALYFSIRREREERSFCSFNPGGHQRNGDSVKKRERGGR